MLVPTYMAIVHDVRPHFRAARRLGRPVSNSGLGAAGAERGLTRRHRAQKQLDSAALHGGKMNMGSQRCQLTVAEYSLFTVAM